MDRKFHSLLIAIVALYIMVSHIFLPLLNDGQDFLFFSPWQLYAFGQQTEVQDLSWDDGKTFLFRDYRAEVDKSGINRFLLFYSFQNKEKLLHRFGRDLQNFCQCDSISLITLSGSMSDHIIFERQLPILQKESLSLDSF